MKHSRLTIFKWKLYVYRDNLWARFVNRIFGRVTQVRDLENTIDGLRKHIYFLENLGRADSQYWHNAYDNLKIELLNKENENGEKR